MRLRSIIKAMVLPHRVVRQRNELIGRVQELQGRLADLNMLFAPPGHFYSPIPSKEDVEKHLARHGVPIRDLPGVPMCDQNQLDTLEQLKTYYPRAPFQSDPVPDLLYHADNPAYSWTDGIVLFCMLSHFRPRTIIEIGSGYSTCAILDTNRISLGSQAQVTSIEPNAELLRSLIAGATDRLTIIESKLQDISLQMFDQLEPRDVLFIDSTHVSKLGSDVNYIFFEILPRLKPGVVIHLHDIYAGFEYPDPWVAEGRAWNEAYLLRAFLQFNEHFRILLFASYLQNAYRQWFEQNMPDTLLRMGGCFWMEKL